MKQVFVAQHPTEAHLVKGLLETNGIAADVRGESLFGARGEAPVTPDTLPSVWVLDDSDVSSALIVLSQYGHQEAAAQRAPWLCPVCSERIEPQFTECWHCGASRPAVKTSECRWLPREPRPRRIEIEKVYRHVAETAAG